jgi:Tfp pilus assembly protein PilF
MRDYASAIEQLRKTLEMDPNFGLAHRFLFQTYVQQRMYEEAITEMARIQAGTSAEEAPIATTLRKGCLPKVSHLLQENLL